MAERFFISIIPIGNANWKYPLASISTSIPVSDTLYKRYKYINDLYCNLNSNDMCLYMPNEYICLKDNIKFMVSVSMQVLKEDDEKYYSPVTLPWRNMQLNYSLAVVDCVLHCVRDNDFILILVNNDEIVKYQDEINFVKDICKDYNKAYLVIYDNIHYTFKEIYEHYKDSCNR